MAQISVKTREGGRIVFTLNEFGEEVDIEQLLRIDYSVLFAELTTFPVLLNRMGLLLAETEHQLRIKELNLSIVKRKLKEEVRIGFEKKKIKWVKDMIDDEARVHPKYIAAESAFSVAQKERDYVNSIFWSMKNKSEILVKLSLTVKQGDMEEFLLQEGLESFNGVDIRYRKPLIE